MEKIKTFLLGFILFSFLILIFAVTINLVPEEYIQMCETLSAIFLWVIACYAVGSSIRDWWKSKEEE